MSYYFSVTLEDVSFDEAIDKVTKALKQDGFGILTNIDIKATMKEKLDINFRKYQILGACNPPLAHKALQAEDKIGLMLPCNVIVQELESGDIEVAAIDPLASMQAVSNSELNRVAATVRDQMKKIIRGLALKE